MIKMLLYRLIVLIPVFFICFSFQNGVLAVETLEQEELRLKSKIQSQTEPAGRLESRFELMRFYRRNHKWAEFDREINTLTKELNQTKNLASAKKLNILMLLANMLKDVPRPGLSHEYFAQIGEGLLPSVDPVKGGNAIFQYYLYKMKLNRLEKKYPQAEEYLYLCAKSAYRTNDYSVMLHFANWEFRQFYHDISLGAKHKAKIAEMIYQYALKYTPPDTKERGELLSVAGEVIAINGDPERGLKIMSQGLEMIEKKGELSANSINDAGYTFAFFEDHLTALRYFRKAISLVKKNYNDHKSQKLPYDGDAKDVAQFLCNTYNAFNGSGQKDSLELYAREAIRYGKEGKAFNLVRFSYLWLIKLAYNEKDYKKSLLLTREIPPQAIDTVFILVSYPIKAECFARLSRPDSAEYYFKLSENFIYKSKKRKKNNVLDYRIPFFLAGKLVYARKNPETALRYADSLIYYQDSIFKNQKTIKISQALKQYDAQSREKEIKLLNQQRDLDRLSARLSQFLFIGTGAVLLLVGGVTVLLYRRNRSKQKTNRLLADQNRKIQSVNAELSNAYEELNATVEQLQEQKKEVESKNLKIEDSIRYAQKIQTAFLPELEPLKNYFKDYKLFFRPRDLVSGDFYWCHIEPPFIYVAVVDCTGHGVPGALMSMAGYHALDEIVKEGLYRMPDEILLLADEHITRSLRQKKDSESKDGMDAGLIAYNFLTSELFFAGAGRPLYLFSRQNFEEIKGDKFPVGGGQHESKSFRLHTRTLQKGDKIYLFSDGLTDQFGGPQNRKFTPARLKDFIITHPNLSLEEQDNDFTALFNNWAKDVRQYDDITLLMLEI